MVTLKTLKDLELGYEGYPPEDERIRQKLKQEAIKWFKDLENQGWKGFDIRDLWLLTGWLQYFFNITEEDLK